MTETSTSRGGLPDFRTRLQRRMGRLSQWRPFLCEGSPLQADAFIVGSNTTRPTGPFWDWWDDHYGFKKSEWYQCQYLPAAGGRPSPTRGNIDKLIGNVRLRAGKAARCIETNVYLQPSPTEKSIINKSSWCFEFLLEFLEPRVMLLHGKKAQRFLLKKLRNYGFGTRTFATCGSHFTAVPFPWGAVLIRTIPHLRATSQSTLSKVATELSDAIEQTRSDPQR